MKWITLISAATVFFSIPAQAQHTFPSFADLVEKTQPSVVNISTVKLPEQSEDADIPQAEEFLQQKNPQQVSLGSGFIIDEGGFIVTNNHVIDGAKEITVTTADNQHFDATVVGTDAKTDIALIKINGDKNFQALSLGDSDAIRVGDWILAIGNPFGLGGSVSAGIISAKSRDIESGPYDNFIQTDASINQGSSGGPMLNLNGEVIGVSTAIFSTSGGNMGIGFATPINQIKFVLKNLKEKGLVERGWIGLKIQPNTEDIAGSLNQQSAKGVVVSAVTQESPAAKAGIEAGDIILAFAGQSVDNARDFSRLVAETAIGQKAEIKLWKDKKEQLVFVDIDKMPEEKQVVQVKTPVKAEQDGFNELGLKLAEVSPDIINAYQLQPQQQGLVVEDVKTDSDAELKGVKKGVVITHLDKKPVFDINDVETYIAEAKAENNRPVLLLIEENNVPHYAAIKLEKDE